MTDHTHDLRFPIGPFEAPTEVTASHLSNWIAEIDALPDALRELVRSFSREQLDTVYRKDGWTVRQVVHHLADSHLNSYVRFKWALTEDRPVIKAYWENRWAELGDYGGTPVEVSLDLLRSLHTRWCVLLRSLTQDDWKREFVHPDSGPVGLALNAGIYAWHGRHHMAHIRNLAVREGWAIPGTKS